MKRVYCPFKEREVKIWQEKIKCATLEDATEERSSGRYDCSDNDWECDHKDDRCALKLEIKRKNGV